MATVLQQLNPQAILNAIAENTYFILSYDELLTDQLYYLNKFNISLYNDAVRQTVKYGVAIILEITDYKLGELTITTDQKYLILDPSRLIS